MPHTVSTFITASLAWIALASTVATAGDAKDLARYDAKIKPSDRQHWSYLPVKKPAVPKLKNAAWVRNPIDAFVLAKLEAKGWKPSPPAAPNAWLRRVYLDVTGLPPTFEEQDAFAKNPTPEAMDAVVKDLLARPTYGERWGRHWLDVVRYAETARLRTRRRQAERLALPRLRHQGVQRRQAVRSLPDGATCRR